MEFFILTISFLIITLIASIMYYKQIKAARIEYEDSKHLVKNIILGFSNQIKKILNTTKLIEEDLNNIQHSSQEAIKISEKSFINTKDNLKSIEKIEIRLNEVEKTLSNLKNQLVELKEPSISPIESVEIQSVVEPPIPFKKDLVLEKLTQTEIDTLIIIEEMKEASVPEIKKLINKTREHTARLLKKLFENGFIDRNTNRMPYRYNIRREIKELIQREKEKIKISV